MSQCRSQSSLCWQVDLSMGEAMYTTVRIMEAML